MVWDDVIENPPTTILGWELKLKESGISHKWSPQLKSMQVMAANKVIDLNRGLAQEQAKSNTKIRKNIDGTFEEIDYTQERLDNIAMFQAKIKKLTAMQELCFQEERIRVALEDKGQVFDVPDKYKGDGSRIDVSKEPPLALPNWVKRTPIGTTYYIDSDNGNDVNAGTSTGAAFATLGKYTGLGLTAGDIGIMRNAMTATYGSGALDFLSNGDVNANLFVKRDYNNAFGDDVDLSVTATATLTIGSKTVTYASDISGVLAAGDWIYADGDDPEEYAYEVASVSTVTATLFLPYLGDQAGSGKTTTNIGAAPVYATTTDSASRIRFYTGDYYWNIKGLEARTNGTTPLLDLQNIIGLRIHDFVGKSGAVTTGEWLSTSGEMSIICITKSRAHNFRYGFRVEDDPITGLAKNCLFDGNSKSGSVGFFPDGSAPYIFEQCEFKNHASSDVGYLTETTGYKMRNCVLSSTKKFDVASTRERFIHMEDFNGTPSKTLVYSAGDGTDDNIAWESETTTVRSGGSAISIKVSPLDNIGEWELLNIPIYHDTSEKTYTIYVKSNATANWTADPTADELELAFEAWGHASNNYRKVTKSTDVADFNGVTTWEALAVTVTAGQAGVGYLTLKYRKPKEASVSNEFYIDPAPVIS